MRRLTIYLIIFSFLLTGCSSSFNIFSQDAPEKEQIAFTEWNIPKTFLPEQINVIGLGDSLTEGIGDELKQDGYFGRITEEMRSWKGVKKVQATNLAKKGRKSDQLLKSFEEPDTQKAVKNAHIIFLSVGGNDIMKVVKKDIFNLQVTSFYKEMNAYSNRLDEIYTIIRELNSDAIIVLAGLYNPFTLVTDDGTELEGILNDWNDVIRVHTILDEKSCFVPVADLLDTNADMVYHTDFFHPNANGYEKMTERYIEAIEQCNLENMSDGKLDFQGAE